MLFVSRCLSSMWEDKFRGSLHVVMWPGLSSKVLDSAHLTAALAPHCCALAQHYRADVEMWADRVSDPWAIVHLSAPATESLGRSFQLCCVYVFDVALYSFPCSYIYCFLFVQRLTGCVSPWELVFVILIVSHVCSPETDLLFFLLFITLFFHLNTSLLFSQLPLICCIPASPPPPSLPSLGSVLLSATFSITRRPSPDESK